jgi:hypothetical protein
LLKRYDEYLQNLEKMKEHKVIKDEINKRNVTINQKIKKF